MSEKCWFGKFLEGEQQCKQPGTWRYGKAIGYPTAMLRESRWCDEHKHEDDVPEGSAPGAP